MCSGDYKRTYCDKSKIDNGVWEKPTWTQNPGTDSREPLKICNDNTDDDVRVSDEQVEDSRERQRERETHPRPEVLTGTTWVVSSWVQSGILWVDPRVRSVTKVLDFFTTQCSGPETEGVIDGHWRTLVFETGVLRLVSYFTCESKERVGRRLSGSSDRSLENSGALINTSHFVRGRVIVQWNKTNKTKRGRKVWSEGKGGIRTKRS